MPKKRLLLFLFIIISLGLMTYQSNRVSLLPFKFLNGILNRFHTIKHSFKETLSSPFKRMLLSEEENQMLKTELSRMMKEQQRCREIFFENKRLRELLSLKEAENKYIATAHIIGKTNDQWSKTYIIDKGRSQGVTKDMIALTDKGLAGKISDAADSYSYVLFLSDINFSVSARIQDSRTEGIISGTGFRKCQLKYIPSEEEVKKGDIVITSGLDSFFPQGIPIGYVSNIKKKGTEIFQKIEVLPFVDSAKVEEVVIIKKE